jgi:hypothetical protein
MKAEHRKELQTNVLADRMGRLVQQMKTKPRRRTVLYVIAAVVVFLGLFFFFRARQLGAQERSEQWFMLEDGFKLYIDKLRSEFPETNAGKAARFQYAWLATWDLGLKRLGADPVQSLDNLEVAEKLYKKLAEDCAGDPVWEPEALYAIAVIEEARALRRDERDKHLEKALDMYKKLARDHKDSAHGKEAQKRVKLLENKDKARDILDFYAELDTRLQVEKRFREAAEFEKLKAKFKQQ